MNISILIHKSSSLLFLIPVFFYENDFTYYEISMIFLTISSLLYHLNVNSVHERRLFYHLDSICIINSSLSSIFNPKLSFMIALLTFFSWKIKIIIYTTSLTYSFYNATILDKSLLMVCFMMNYLAFSNYLLLKKWNLYNRWMWHLGNSLTITIGSKYKSQIV